MAKLYWRVKRDGKWTYEAVSQRAMRLFLHCACSECNVIFDIITPEVLDVIEWLGLNLLYPGWLPDVLTAGMIIVGAGDETFLPEP